MRHILYFFCLLIFLYSGTAQAENTIKVLMLQTPYDPLPSEQAQKVTTVSGKVYLKGNYYSGDLTVVRDEKGIYVVQTLPFDQYIEGVVASESGKDWEFEALKAQAVASRTYASYYRSLNAGKLYHLTSTVNDQLYKGTNTDPLIASAVQATEGEILTHKHEPIKALFHATCEGKTELHEEIWDGSYPYLRSVDCQSSNAPYENWVRKFTHQVIGRALDVEALSDITIESYTATGRVKTLRITTDTKDSSGRTVKATEFRSKLGYGDIPSTLFSVEREGDFILFRGKGYGHGVGLSQWGALEMARQGKGYQDILSHYYPGTILENYDEMFSRQGSD